MFSDLTTSVDGVPGSRQAGDDGHLVLAIQHEECVHEGHRRLNSLCECDPPPRRCLAQRNAGYSLALCRGP